jgi:hypothetical protein
MKVFKALSLVLGFCSLQAIVLAQSDIPKKLKKLGLSGNDVVYSDEKVLAFPRGFIYDVNNPNEAYYFGCFASEIKEVKKYFKKPKKVNLFSTQDTIYRSLIRDYIDTIPIESLAQRIEKYNAQSKVKTSNTDYVILYYWSNFIKADELNKNIKFFNEFTKNNSDYNIKFLVVSTSEN